jgi:hypothetical protein
LDTRWSISIESAAALGTTAAKFGNWAATKLPIVKTRKRCCADRHKEKLNAASRMTAP